jgi:hypothetical protein
MKVYIIILNYNGWEDTIECLESVLKLKYSHFQILVIDNSNSENDVLEIENWAKGINENKIDSNYDELVYPTTTKPLDYIVLKEEYLLNKSYDNKIVLVKAKRNNGFAAGNNIALDYVKKFGENEAIIWLLNNDTVISKDTLASILFEISKYKGDKNLTLFGTPLLEYYEPNKIQAIGGKYNKFFALTSHIGEGIVFDRILNVNEFTIDYPIGASVIVTNKYLKTISLLCEDYFLFFEELDWALRLKARDGNVHILNVFGVYHKQGGSTKTKTKSTGSKTEFIDLLSIKNRILFTKKYYKNYLWSVILFLLIVTIPKRIIAGNFKRAFEILKIIIK